MREGAIFKNLPTVATLLGEGRIVDIIVSTSEARYLYRVTATEVSEPSNVDLFRPTEEPSLTLLTCVPNYVYSHRLLVNAILVGKAPLG
jgi:LPXTG-site transpeptidase (sortase) family protein